MRTTLRPRWRKVRADLGDSVMRTFLVVASIGVGVFAVGTIGTAYVVLNEDINVSYAAAHPANIELWTDPFPDDLVTVVEHVPGVEAAEGRTALTTRFHMPDDSWRTLNIAAIDDFEDSRVNIRTPADGRSVPGKHELVLEHLAVETLGVSTGDSAEIELADGTTRTLPIVGVVLDQGPAAEGFAALPLGYVTRDTLDWLGQSANNTQLLVVVDKGKGDEGTIAAVAEEVKHAVENAGFTVHRQVLVRTDVHPLASTVSAVLAVLGALGLLVMVLSGSLIANTLNALLSRHLRQIGVMKLVGARSRQVLVMYLVLILTFGTIALVIAVPLGALGGQGLARFIATQIGVELQGFRLVPVVVALQILGGLAVPLAAGYVPVHGGSRITVRRALSDNITEGASGAGRIHRAIGALPLISRPLMLSIRNTFRRKGRLALTLFTLTMGGAVFIAVFNARDSMGAFLDTIGQHFMADVTVELKRPYLMSTVSDIALGVPGVKGIEGWGLTTAELLNADDSTAQNFIVLAPPVDTKLLNPELIAGRWLLPGEGRAVVVSDAIYDTRPGLVPGDPLRLDIAGKDEEWTVVGVFRFSSPGEGDGLAYIDRDQLAALTDTPGRAASFRLIAPAASRAEQVEISNAVDERLRAAGIDVSRVASGLADREDASQGINILTGFLLMMALLTALVGSIGLAGTMGMNVLERTREFGVMRAIGAVDSEIVKTVVVEGLLIGLISWALGAVMSFPITLVILRGLAVAFTTPITPVFTAEGFVVWLGVVLILAVIASVLPARSAARLTIREVLAYE